jgi:hypothetical protein
LSEITSPSLTTTALAVIEPTSMPTVSICTP